MLLRKRQALTFVARNFRIDGIEIVRSFEIGFPQMDTSQPTPTPTISLPTSQQPQSKEISYIIAGVVLFPALIVVTMICCLFFRPFFYSRGRRKTTDEEEEAVGDTDTICEGVQGPNNNNHQQLGPEQLELLQML